MPPQITSPEMRYPKIDHIAPSSLPLPITYSPDFKSVAVLGFEPLVCGKGSVTRKFRKARISPTNQAAVIASADMANVGRSTVAGEVVLVTIRSSEPIKITFAK